MVLRTLGTLVILGPPIWKWFHFQGLFPLGLKNKYELIQDWLLLDKVEANVMRNSHKHRVESLTILLFILFFPNPSRDPQLQLFPFPSREEECHVSLYNEAIVAVSDFFVVVPNASRVSLPYQLPAISTDLEAVTVVSGICFVPHESEKCHVNWCHTQLKGFKMKTEILAKTVEDLAKVK